MATNSAYRFSMGRLMIDVVLLALAFGLFGEGLRDAKLSISLVAFLIFGAVWFVFAMEVTYWCFLRPDILQPRARKNADRKARDLSEKASEPRD